ncbi:hypothetical protein BTJ68_03945 [Hortaea werneckii EXF-2000]|uniref:Uncharacterized protein n=1 Tax=Hortaea werneckii EXF-2000 TaxID=1157616 RepID=A0A1Z5TKB5_HORWE|nr:hypothetical protein BTJ68_03945 [Hortaea werneckii EXF-2000]
MPPNEIGFQEAIAEGSAVDLYTVRCFHASRLIVWSSTPWSIKVRDATNGDPTAGTTALLSLRASPTGTSK